MNINEYIEQVITETGLDCSMIRFDRLVDMGNIQEVILFDCLVDDDFDTIDLMVMLKGTRRMYYLRQFQHTPIHICISITNKLNDNLYPYQLALI